MREVPQICAETGVSEDYSNEYNLSVSIFVVNGRQGVPNAIWRFSVKRHTDRSPEEEYAGVITDQNHDVVRRLDK